MIVKPKITSNIYHNYLMPKLINSNEQTHINYQPNQQMGPNFILINKPKSHKLLLLKTKQEKNKIK